MEDRLCKCGCGGRIFNNKWEYVRGHKPGVKKKSKKAPARPVADEVEEEAEFPTVTVELDDSQLTRIWSALTLRDKAVGIVNALNTDHDE